MPFPFMPYGLLLGIGILAAVLIAFGLLLEIANRSFIEARISIGPGLVAGVQAWVREREELRPASSPSPASPTPPAALRTSATASAPGASIEDLTESPALETHRVRR